MGWNTMISVAEYAAALAIDVAKVAGYTAIAWLSVLLVTRLGGSTTEHLYTYLTGVMFGAIMAMRATKRLRFYSLRRRILAAPIVHVHEVE